MTKHFLDELYPLRGLLMKARVGHEYWIRLKGQEVWCIEGTKEEVFGGREFLWPEEVMEGVGKVRLESGDKLRVKVEK